MVNWVHPGGDLGMACALPDAQVVVVAGLPSPSSSTVCHRPARWRGMSDRLTSTSGPPPAAGAPPAAVALPPAFGPQAARRDKVARAMAAALGVSFIGRLSCGAILCFKAVAGLGEAENNGLRPHAPAAACQ